MLRGDNDEGLSAGEAAEALQRVGPNKLPAASGSAVSTRAQLMNVATIFLGPAPFAALWLSVATFFATRHDVAGGVLTGFLVLAAVVRKLRQSSDNEFELNHRAMWNIAADGSLRQRAMVRRDGIVVEVDAEELVDGDCLNLLAGATVPADCTVNAAQDDGGSKGTASPAPGIDVDESQITGESLPRAVTPGDGTVVFAGSVVVRGTAKCTVQQTGPRMRLWQVLEAQLQSGAQVAGRANQHFQATETTATYAGRFTAALAVVLAVIVLLVVRFRGGDAARPPAAHAALVAALLLPASLPLGLSLVPRVLRAGALRQMSASDRAILPSAHTVDKLAAVDTLLVDRNGTVTHGAMAVTAVRAIADGENDKSMRYAAALAYNWRDGPKDALSSALFDMDDDDGEDDDNAVAAHCDARYRHVASVRVSVPPITVGTVRKLSVGDATDEKGRKTYTCTAVGQAKVLQNVLRGLTEDDAAGTATARQQLAEWEALGYVTVGVATAGPFPEKPEVTAADTTRQAAALGWRWLGVVALVDAPREDAVDALNDAADAGIHVKILTGSGGPVALATMRRLGMLAAHEGRRDRSSDASRLLTVDAAMEHGLLMHGDDLSSADGIQRAVDNGRLRAASMVLNSSGVVKLELTGFAADEQHQASDDSSGWPLGCVAVTGDGAGDVIGMRRATVGIAVAGATDGCREVADMVMVDPGIGLIVSTLRAGRAAKARVVEYLIYRVSVALHVAISLAIAAVAWPYLDYFLGATLNELPPFIAKAVVKAWFDDAQEAAAVCLPLYGGVLLLLLADVGVLAAGADRRLPLPGEEAVSRRHVQPSITGLTRHAVLVLCNVAIAVTGTVFLVYGLLHSVRENGGASRIGRLPLLDLRHIPAVLFLHFVGLSLLSYVSTRAWNLPMVHPKAQRPTGGVTLPLVFIGALSTLLAAYFPGTAIHGMRVAGLVHDSAGTVDGRWSLIGAVWAYTIGVALVQDIAKVAVHALIAKFAAAPHAQWSSSSSSARSSSSAAARLQTHDADDALGGQRTAGDTSSVVSMQTALLHDE